MDLKNKEAVRDAIKKGIPCFYRYGFAWKGAAKRPISKKEALKKLPMYSPGMGFYELMKDKDGLVFNEYSESDMM